MSNNRVAVRYAKAILELSQEQNNADETYAEMKLISEQLLIVKNCRLY